ncbi:hypothetical protein EJ653_16895, partial [Pseudomonas aeruginosa]
GVSPVGGGVPLPGGFFGGGTNNSPPPGGGGGGGGGPARAGFRQDVSDARSGSAGPGTTPAR